LSSSSTTAREARRLEAALACVSQLTSGKSAGKSSASVQARAGLAFQETLVDELASENTPLARDSRAVREEAAKVASALAGAHLAPEGARRPAELEVSGTEGTETLERLRAKTAALLESFAAGADAASRAALLDNPAASSASAAEAEAEARAARSRRWLEGVLLTVIQLAKHGDVACPAASDVVARCIPAILRAQEAPDRDFALVAKRALTYLKYVVFPPARCRLAARGVLLGLQDDNWHARAAALKFAQAFAFRHAFLLDGVSRESLRERVVEATRDPQIEVRALASATLVGFLRGAEAADGSAARFRSAALKRASEAFSGVSKTMPLTPSQDTNNTNNTNNGAMLDAHSSVLLLASCVLSAPYDVPGWMPAALEALSRWASSPSAPVRETVQRTFGEFKKTHQDTWLETKAAFTSEQWENVSAGMELAPSYIS
jgi:proteasome activator subunit 4